jgi:DNA-binding MarR family transcriptional regulator
MSTPDYRDADPEHLLSAVGPAFSKLRRTALLEVENPVSSKDLSRTLVLNIVEDAEKEPGTEVSVGSVAETLGVDPSVGSRMVSDCISAGYLVRAASQQDGRRTILQLSEGGREMLGRFRKHQREAFEYITAEWPEGDRLEFARLMLRYVDTLADLKSRGLARDASR